MEFFKTQWRRIAGIAFIVIGVFALLTPLTPGSWLIFVGAEMIGWELVHWKRVKTWWERIRKEN